jgi:hypothetical protein
LTDAASLVVKPEAAAAQFEAEKQSEPPAQSAKGKGNGGGAVTVVSRQGDGRTGDDSGGGEGPDGGTTDIEPPRLCRFHASARLDAMRLGRDASTIAEEIVQHLTSIIGAEVEVTLEIQAHLPDGASPELVRTITENCRTLKFADCGFEEE